MFFVSELGGNVEGATWRAGRGSAAGRGGGEVTDLTLLPLVLSTQPAAEPLQIPPTQLSQEAWVLQFVNSLRGSLVPLTPGSG